MSTFEAEGDPPIGIYRYRPMPLQVAFERVEARGGRTYVLDDQESPASCRPCLVEFCSRHHRIKALEARMPKGNDPDDTVARIGTRFKELI